VFLTVINDTCFIGMPKKLDPAAAGASRRAMATGCGRSKIDGCWTPGKQLID